MVHNHTIYDSAGSIPGYPGLATVEAGPSTRFLSSHTRRLYTWWAGFGPNRLPRRQDFDILDHPALASRIFLVEVLAVSAYRFRVQGEDVLRVVGRNRTNVIVAPQAGDGYDVRLCAYYDEIAARRQAMRCVGTARYAFRNHAWFESVDCPLTDEAGVVTHIVGVLEPLTADAVSAEFPDLLTGYDMMG